ncbi:hypothetical protein [Goekera deserti]|uniref:Uncharacterized protein n=1 Tax=Goekera deserti TaxID=2497753 RepID=A0A7K3WCH7_9ACTN|nr:hypothetical protein [Goekera deserti]NDI48277.1 hypothetical protein [Goekera deserti]NEL54026.1 hypothetical protein [Goekera deserti]
MTETSPTHSEDPAEGAVSGTENDTGGRTPHTEQPAEGGDAEQHAREGVDADSRITDG